MSAVMAAVAASAAVALTHGPRSTAQVSRLVPRPQARPRRGARGAGLTATAGLLVSGALALGGAGAGVLAAVLLTVGGTTAVLVTARRREQLRLRAEAEVARGCALLAAEVRAGRPPESAVEVAAVDCAVLGPAAAALSVGDDPARTWRGQAAGPGCAGLDDLARVWQVSRSCGAPMGPSLDQVAAALDREAEVGRTVRAELASAQATGRLMSVLPVVGVGLGYTIGGDPLQFLLGSRIGLVCTLVATLLACAGLLWTHALGRLPGRA